MKISQANERWSHSNQWIITPPGEGFEMTGVYWL